MSNIDNALSAYLPSMILSGLIKVDYRGKLIETNSE